MKISSRFFLLFTIFNVKLIESVLPPGIQVCHRNDPNISDCVARAIDTVRPRLVHGDLGGGFIVPALEPFIIKELQFSADNGLKVYLRDINIRGTSNYKIEKLRANLKDLKLDVLVSLPKLDINAKYKMFITFFGAPLKSDGDYITQFIGSRIRFSLRGQKYLKNGQDFVKFDPVVIKFERGTVSHLKITNLFGGNRILSEIIHALMINNPELVLKNFYPQLEGVLSRALTSIANKIVETTSFDDFLPF